MKKFHCEEVHSMPTVFFLNSKASVLSHPRLEFPILFLVPENI